MNGRDNWPGRNNGLGSGDSPGVNAGPNTAMRKRAVNGPAILTGRLRLRASLPGTCVWWGGGIMVQALVRKIIGVLSGE
jgi:hypothetical protein